MAAADRAESRPLPRHPLAAKPLEPRVDPADELRDPLEVVAFGAVEHTVQQLLKRLRAQPAQTARVERAETGAVGEPVILGRVVAATNGAGVSNGEGRKATIRPGAVTQGHQTDLRRSLGAFGARSLRPDASAIEALKPRDRKSVV